MTPRFKRGSHAQKGLCLPEVMVCCAIALIGIAVTLSSFLSGRFASTGAKHWTQAMNLARARVEYLKSLRYAELAALPPLTTEPNLLLDGRTGVNSIYCTRVTTLTPEQDGITISVLVYWSERTVGSGPVPLTYRLRTWVAFPGPPPGT